MTKKTEIKVAVAENDIQYLKDSMDQMHEKIDKQNGRIDKTEIAAEDNKNELSFMKGVGTLAVIVVPIIVSLAFYIFTK